jgi:hypothetical protein
MNKTHRKELELRLVKTIDEVLSKQNATAAASIRKTTVEACKLIAKTLKQKTEIAIKTKPVKTVKKKANAKTVVKKVKTVKKVKSKK